MIWLLRIVNFVFLISALFAFVSSNWQLLSLSTIVLGINFFVSGTYKGYTIGLDTVRGKFWVLLSMIGIAVGIGVALDNNLYIHIVGRVFLVVALVFMFIGLARRGLVLRGVRLLIFLIVFLLTVAGALYVYTKFPAETPLKAFFLLFDVLIATFTIANFSVYLGSDLGKRWFIGLFAMGSYATGDLLFYLEKDAYMLVWSIALFLIALVSHIED